jgi:hypothetical protein
MNHRATGGTRGVRRMSSAPFRGATPPNAAGGPNRGSKGTPAAELDTIPRSIAPNSSRAATHASHKEEAAL